ncbi:PREDICTED: glutamic acid-rich protein-like isoform X2 [Nelumbo nucifera]|uniref:Glutamic acid-rich protein-like isoform X2 n=1 Tax=Nelumbo nucifera TaxID=4432 RepID=A0A1U8Q7B1_NELNU|nr:PREDICTED: glutamic acid-rich protein-like isoform X2 [Nelumbo nucifera]
MQREKDKAKKERRKEKKREKKEKKEKDRTRDKGEVGKKHNDEKKHKKSKVDQKGGEHPKNIQDDSEQLEKSVLTEDHGQAAVSQNVYDSSDSTGNSHKRKRLSSPSDGSQNNGSILRIRLPLMKHKEPEALPSKAVSSCNSIGSDVVAQGRCEVTHRSGNEQACSSSCRIETATAVQNSHVKASSSSIELPCSTSSIGIVAQDKAPSSTCGVPKRDKIKKELQKYRDLVENWVPPPIQREYAEFDDQDWLFEVKPHGRHEAKRVKVDSDSLCRGSSDLWPQACYLPEVDVYALPYTVPF